MPDANTIALTGRTSADGIRYAVAVRALGCDVRRLGETLICSSDTVLLVAAATDFRYDDPLREVYARLNAAEARGYEALLEAHVADITRLTRRCGLALKSDPELESLPTDARLKRVRDGGFDTGLINAYFAFGRYLLASCSRPGSLPANLQGIWNQDMTPAWDSKYTININTEMNYWPCQCCNLAELLEPLETHLRRMKPHGERVARDMYGAGGWMATTTPTYGRLRAAGHSAQRRVLAKRRCLVVPELVGEIPVRWRCRASARGRRPDMRRS